MTAPMRCPKCDTEQPPADACRRCGLAADRMAGFARAAEDDAPPELHAAWARAEAAWDDPAAHDRVVELASIGNRFAWLARRYRGVVRARPDDATAPTQLARLARMAEATLAATRTPPPAKRPTAFRGAIALIIVLIAAAVAGLVWSAMRTSGGVTRSPDETQARPPVRR